MTCQQDLTSMKTTTCAKHLPPDLPPIIHVNRGEQFRCQNVYDKKRCPTCSKERKPASLRPTDNPCIGICETCGRRVDKTCDKQQFLGRLGSGSVIELKCQRCKKMSRIEKL